MDKIGSDISSSEDELLTGERIENNYSPIEKDFKLDTKPEHDDDQMSLSSLSSTEQKIEEPKMEIMQQQQQQPPMPGHFNPYQQYPGKVSICDSPLAEINTPHFFRVSRCTVWLSEHNVCASARLAQPISL